MRWLPIGKNFPTHARDVLLKEKEKFYRKPFTEGTEIDYEELCEFFQDSNVCGLNFSHIWMDFREDPENGEIKTERLPFNSLISAEEFEKKNGQEA
jgi:hypothetical protein